MPKKEVEKIEEMGRELYDKTEVALLVAAVSDLNSSKPVDLLNNIKRKYSDYALLYFSKNPTAVNIFASESVKKMMDIEQILSPLPWKGTIRPLMSPAFSKDEDVKLAAAIFNGYADMVDQVAQSKGVKLASSVGSGSKDSFKLIRWIFYGILLYFLGQYIYSKVRRVRGEQ